MKKIFTLAAFILPLANVYAIQPTLELELETQTMRDSQNSFNGVENSLALEAGLADVFLNPTIGVEVASEIAEESDVDMEYAFIGASKKFELLKLEAEAKLPTSESKRKKENAVLSMKAKRKIALENAMAIELEAKMKQTFKDTEDKQKYSLKSQLVKKLGQESELAFAVEVDSDLDHHALTLIPSYGVKNLVKNVDMELFVEIPAVQTDEEYTLLENTIDHSSLGVELSWSVL